MKQCRFVLLLAIFVFAGCGGQRSNSGELEAVPLERAVQITGEVHSFMQSVAQDVTKDGPTAWRREFTDSPAFFMASEGRLIFGDSAAASAGIQNLPEMIKQIELKWGEDLRVDPLTHDLAVVGATYHESRVDPAGARLEENGYFTGVVQYRLGRWEIRDAHWSVVPAAVK